MFVHAVGMAALDDLHAGIFLSSSVGFALRSSTDMRGTGAVVSGHYVPNGHGRAVDSVAVVPAMDGRQLEVVDVGPREGSNACKNTNKKLSYSQHIQDPAQFIGHITLPLAHSCRLLGGATLGAPSSGSSVLLRQNSGDTPAKHHRRGASAGIHTSKMEQRQRDASLGAAPRDGRWWLWCGCDTTNVVLLPLSRLRCLCWFAAHHPPIYREWLR